MSRGPWRRGRAALLGSFVVFAGAGGPGLAAPGAATAADDARETGRALTAALLGGDVDTLWVRMTPELQRVFGSLAAFHAFRDQVRTAGRETAVLEESAAPQANGVVLYTRVARFEGVPQPLLFAWALAPERRIAGLVVRQAPSRR